MRREATRIGVRREATGNGKIKHVQPFSLRSKVFAVIALGRVNPAAANSQNRSPNRLEARGNSNGQQASGNSKIEHVQPLCSVARSFIEETGNDP